DALRKCGPLVARRREAVVAERGRAMEALSDLPLDVFPSQANFLWLRARGLSGHELPARLGRSRVIAHLGAEVGSPDHIRVALQSRSATDRLVEALKRAVA
ncbi:MAG TPA: hypothetical protein VKA96_01175, partial [Solirubrobacteraceae bacterium]|nr:hypothetical protein [Solirubrobacteraceae bacterium]